MDDIAIRAPRSLPEPIDPALKEMVAGVAGMLRAEGTALARATIGDDPTRRLATMLGVMKALVFGRAEQTVRQVEDGALRVACGEGCTACCHQSVAATIAEAALIALRLADPADPRRAAILEAADARAAQGPRERRRAAAPCPLLVEDRCSVYADRPLMCRSVLSSNAASCHASLAHVREGGEPTATEYFVAAQYFICGDSAALQGICKDLGLQHDVFDLTLMLAAMLRDPTLVERWSDGERVLEARPLPASSVAA